MHYNVALMLFIYLFIVCLFVFIVFGTFMEITGCVINRVGPDQTSRSRSSDLGLHFLEYFKTISVTSTSECSNSI